MTWPNPGRSTTWKWLTLHEHPVEPPGRRPPRRPLFYFGMTLFAIAAFVGLLWVLELLGYD